MKKRNKKAVELNITTIIIVILAVLALVIIALAFTGGMSTMWEWISSIWGGQQGIQEATAVETCNFYVTTGDKFNYCCTGSKIRGHEDKKTCQELYNYRSGNGFTQAAENFCDGFNFEDCPGSNQ